PPKIRIDGALDDWSGIAPYASAPDAALLRALYVASDQNRFYLRLDLGPGAPPSVGVALDVLDPARGDRRLPPPLQATWSRGAEFVLVVEPEGGRAELFIDRAMNYSRWSRILSKGEGLSNDAPLRPVRNADGRYIPLIIETNRERVSRSGVFYPARHLDW